jgi:serine O-acetyltransferase
MGDKIMFERFAQDAARWVLPQQVVPLSDVTWLEILRMLYHHLPLRAMLWFRVGSWLVSKRVPLMKGFVYRLLFRKYGMEISPGTDIGGGFYIAHPIGSVISPKRIGKNCTIIHSVTIGMRNEWAFPEIGDNVFIGAGARILGGIRIGNNAVIGANAVVIHDVPDGATVVGVPAKVIKIKETLA